MTVKCRIEICRLIEKMERQADYCNILGIENVSCFGGYRSEAKTTERDEKPDETSRRRFQQ